MSKNPHLHMTKVAIHYDPPGVGGVFYLVSVHTPPPNPLPQGEGE